MPMFPMCLCGKKKNENLPSGNLPEQLYYIVAIGKNEQ
jgi:hypothetical protein